MKKSDIFWQTYLKIEKELLEVAKYIYVTDEKIVNHNSQKYTSQLETFSPYIADLIIRTCIEIEAISKELYFDFGGTKTRGSKEIFFDEDCLKLLDIKCQTHKKVVLLSCLSFNLTKEENTVFKPLREAHKRQGTDWEKAYQALKHDRYSSICKGTIKNLIHALAALYLLNIYYRDVKLNSKYLEVSNLDFSFGSAIFSIKPPNHNYVIDVINGKEFDDILVSDDSPYILKYVDSTYKAVIEAYKENIEEQNKYILSQPEFKEPEFKKIVKEGLQKEKENPRERFIYIWELCKYRLNKKTPSNLSYEKRKQLFLSSNEWNGRIRKNNKHKSAEELTPENIQAEINSAAICAGMELEQQFRSMRMQKAYKEGYCELIIDKGNIKYN